MSMAKAKGRSGFHDLVCFNKALLVKQSRIIMHNPKSLTAKIISAKYFHRGSFMSTKLGIGHHIRGIVFWQAWSYSRRGFFGGLVIDVLCQFEEINGSQG
jgi:hypothetical protein